MAYFRKTHIDGGYTPIPPTPPYNPPIPPTPPIPESGSVPVIPRTGHVGNTNVWLYSNISDNNVIDKNITLLLLADNVNFKRDTSVINPVITVYSNVDLSGCNYCYIDTFERYYYVTDIICTKPDYYTLSLKVDVLMSYGNSIKQCDGILVATESDTHSNMYIDNGSFVNRVGKSLETKLYPYGFDDNATNILIVAGA